MRGVVLLKDGRLFRGTGFGAVGTRIGEIVFNTAMTGYQEIVTDPSYREQVVVMTYPHIGNYGVNDCDPESDRVQASGLVARSFCREPSSWRAQGDLHSYLAEHQVPAVQGIDTRALVRHIRSQGAMTCAISTEDLPVKALAEQMAAWPGMAGRALATEVTCTGPYVASDPAQPALRLALVDGGCKQHILRLLSDRNCYVRVHPITDPAGDWMHGVDAVFVSNGPGDPAALGPVVDQLRQVIGTKPTLGICLGHQLLALALGATTYKLPFGHRGANHPVQDLSTGRVEITSQNHGFAVDRPSLEAVGASITHLNLNDHTVSGFTHPTKRVMAVQYHPEAAPGPHDSRPLFDRMIQFASKD